MPCIISVARSHFRCDVAPVATVTFRGDMTSQPQGDEMEVNQSACHVVPTNESAAENVSLSTNAAETEKTQSEEGNRKTTKKRGRPGKKTSDVWSHFKIHADGRAECKYCGQDYKYDTKTCGTSTLRTHVEVKCKKYPLRIEDKKQKAITQYTKSKTANEEEISCKKYDPKEVGVRLLLTLYWLSYLLDMCKMKVFSGIQGIFTQPLNSFKHYSCKRHLLDIYG